MECCCVCFLFCLWNVVASTGELDVCQMTNGKLVVKDMLRRNTEQAAMGSFRVLYFPELY